MLTAVIVVVAAVLVNGIFLAGVVFSERGWRDALGEDKLAAKASLK